MDREEMANTVLVDVISEDEIKGVVCYKGDVIIKLPIAHKAISKAIMEVMANLYLDDTSQQTINEMLTKLELGDASIQ